MSTGNPYAILGVPESATAEEIKKAYRRQMRLAAVDIHPDVSEAEKEVLQQRMVEVNWAFEALSGSRRQAVDAELRRQRTSEAVREQQLKQEQDRRRTAWESAQRRAREAHDQERAARAWQEAVLEQERLHRVRREAQEHARRTAQRRRDEERRYREAAWIREYVDEETGYRHEVHLDGTAATQAFLDALWEVLAPRAGQDVYETLEMTQGQWASAEVWASGIDGMPLTGLEHARPATYCFRGRGAPGAYGGPRGDHYVTVLHVDDYGQPVVGGFRGPGRNVPVSTTAAEPQDEGATPSPMPLRHLAVVGTAFRLVGILLKWALILLAGAAAVALVLAVVLAVIAAKG